MREWREMIDMDFLFLAGSVAMALATIVIVVVAMFSVFRKN